MKKSFLIFGMIMLTVSFALAQENITNISQTNETATNITNITNASINQTPSLILINFFPKEVKVGDVQFSIQLHNVGNENLSNLVALITGNGFSTYDVIPIDSLGTGEKGYIFVMGNLKQGGNINLSLKVGQTLFYQNISVIDSNSNQEKLNELAEQQEKTALIQNLSKSMDNLKANYSSLENALAQKKDDGYDVSGIVLADLKSYIRSIQSNLLSENADAAKVNLDLALDEYGYQKGKLDNAKEIPTINRLKDNIVIFSTIAGALITFFALYELLKRKSDVVVERVHSARASKEKTDTKENA